MKLPETYKGYQTSELLKLREDFLAKKLLKNPAPREKYLALGQLLREYKLAPVFQDESRPENLRPQSCGTLRRLK